MITTMCTITALCCHTYVTKWLLYKYIYIAPAVMGT